MSVEFGGMGSMVVTMKAAAVTTGGIAGMAGPPPRCWGGTGW